MDWRLGVEAGTETPDKAGSNPAQSFFVLFLEGFFNEPISKV